MKIKSTISVPAFPSPPTLLCSLLLASSMITLIRFAETTSNKDKEFPELTKILRRFLSPGVVRGSFGNRSGVVRELFGSRSGIVRDRSGSFRGRRSKVVRESFGGRSGVVQESFRNRSGIVRDRSGSFRGRSKVAQDSC